MCYIYKQWDGCCSGRTIEQDQRFIKKITRPMMGFESFDTARATLAGVEIAHMIRKGPLGDGGRTPFQVFVDLAGQVRLAKGLSARARKVCHRTARRA
nr:DDE-type integrase/transposase/recombinase [Palleronia caenipelagi]